MCFFNSKKQQKERLKPMKLTAWQELTYAVNASQVTHEVEMNVTYDDIMEVWARTISKTVIYVEDVYNPIAHELFDRHYEDIARKFEMLGYTFIYAPREVEAIAKYYAAEMPDVEWNTATMLELMGWHCDNIPAGAMLITCEEKEGAMGTLRGVCLDADTIEGLVALLKGYWERLDNGDREIRFRLSEESDERYRARHASRKCCKVSRKRDSLPMWLEQTDTEEAPTLDEEMEQLSEEDEQLLAEIQERVKRLRQHGVKERLIQQMVKLTVKESRLQVTDDAHLLLIDYDNKEVKMLPIDKVVYLFFLRHPEGVALKELMDHREELNSLYIRVLGCKSLTESQRRSVNRLCNPMDNSINEKISRIRLAFKSVVHESIANNYTIQGARGEKRYIDLSEELIVWDQWGY